MKKAYILVGILLILAACERERLVPDVEIPDWLKERIAQDEALMEANPRSGLNIGAWIRYRYEDRYYFEYHNMLSSAFPPVYNYEGMKLMMEDKEYPEYQEKKCCKMFVWKGPDYFGED